MFTDTHAHLTDASFVKELPGVIQRSSQAGVTRIVTVATDLDDARQALEITRRFPNIRAAVGIHPNNPPESCLCDMREVARLAGNPNVVAIGETGLDYYRQAAKDLTLRQRQKDLFWAHLELAKERNLPVIIHNRSADADLLEIVRAHSDALPKESRPWGVMHCFSGDVKLAFDCIEAGLLISFTGILTFSNAEVLRDVAKKVLLEHVMLETDCPYLAPMPHRGKRNEPSYIPLVAATLAEVRGASVEEVARITTANASRLFRWSEP